MTKPPLTGLRVIETATGISGPYAGRMLASLGAQVIKVEPSGGDPARKQQLDDLELLPNELSPLFIHLNAAKLNIASSEVDTAWADVVLSSYVLDDLTDTPWHPDVLATHATRLVTTTAWGADAEHPGTIADELLVQTASGFLGFNGDDDSPPLRLPGW